MAEHHTHGRQGQGARRRNKNQGRHRRQRMPRPEPTPARKPSLLQRILSFFGFGKKNKPEEKQHKKNRNNPPQKVRVAKTNNHGGNPAGNKGRRHATSTPPTRNARLYVGNLSYEATESELEDLFKGFGNVRSIDIIYNPRTYKSKGYAFVEMCLLEDARKAAEVLHGQPFMGWELMVSAASERPDSAQEKTADKPQENLAPAAPVESPAPEEPTAPSADEPAEADRD